MNELNKIKNSENLESFRIKYLGRKGELTAILRSLKDLSLNQRKKIGKEAHEFRKELEEAFKEKSKKLQPKKLQTDKIDITAPGIKLPQGHLHPITQVMRQAEAIFQSMGFKVIEGPDIEIEYYNFDALNIPREHPARDAWDTFWLKPKSQKLMRTHTSPMQIRYMEKHNPPLRIIVPGRCFRHEAIDASHSHTFYQLEGLVIDKNTSVANFKAIIEEFLRGMFGKSIEMRLKPDYFPFVEPGFQIDIRRPSGSWLELMGAGMVHPNVFKAVGYNPAHWQGFAFGLGFERLAMIKHNIDDTRLFYSGDLRFLNQF